MLEAPRSIGKLPPHHPWQIATGAGAAWRHLVGAAGWLSPAALGGALLVPVLRAPRLELWGPLGADGEVDVAP